jgi:hypothetical protein
MTTRRWLIAVAAVSAGLGGYREATRLKRSRDEYVTRAATHGAVEADCRRLVSRFASSLVNESTANPQLMSFAQMEIAFDNLEAGFGIPESRSTAAEEDAHDRFKEAQAREHILEVRRLVILNDYVRRRAEYLQRNADYHAQLARKYERAARYPWLPVEPDPPLP